MFLNLILYHPSPFKPTSWLFFYQANLNGDNCLGLDEFVQLQLKYQQHTSVEEVEDALKVFERG